MIDLAAVPGGLATIGVLVVASLGLVVGLAATRDSGSSDFPPAGSTVEDTFDPDDDAENPPQLVDLKAPDIKTATFGLPQKLYRMRRNQKKRRKFAQKGYVQWYLIDDTFPTPKFVKPETDGSGIPYYEHDGKRYFFPKDARVASEEQGIWTYFHKDNEADPINLRDPTEYALPADVVETYATLQVTTDPPSWFDSLDMDAGDLFKYAIIGFIVIMLGRSLLMGGA